MSLGSQPFRFIVTLAIAIVTTTPALIGSAAAQSFGSSYTSTAEKDCRVKNTGRDSSLLVVTRRIDSEALEEPPNGKTRHACSGLGGTYG